jgi:hypothetical protein
LTLAVSALEIYGAAAASFGSIVALLALGWNVWSAETERRARRVPDVHAAVIIDTKGGAASLAFGNAGPALARHVSFLIVEGDTASYGGIGLPFLKPDEVVRIPVAVTVTFAKRPPLVWAYMDRDGNVYVRSNKNDRRVYQQPTEEVDLAEIFREWYPGVDLSGHRLLPLLIGE